MISARSRSSAGERDDHAFGGFGAVPKNEQTLLPTLQPAAILADDLRAFFH
jgi:hypothetical protein